MRCRPRSTLKWSCTLLTVLLLVIWFSSKWRGFALYMLPTLAISADSGQFGIGWLEPWSVVPARDGLGWQCRNSTFFQLRWTFEIDRGPIQTGHTAMTLYLPGWFVVLLAGALTLGVWYRDRRRAPGHCVKCNYDLRATTTGVCPECGAAITPRATT